MHLIHVRRSARQRSTVIGAIFAVGLAMLLQPQVANATLAGSDFEGGDGNLVVDSTFDWNSFSTTTWTGTAPNRTSTKTTGGWKFLGIEDADATTSDNAFAGGTKQDDQCPTKITAKAPNKDDLKRVYLSSKTAANGHTYLNLAWVRIPQNTTSPSAHVAFEFSKATAGLCTGSDIANRVAGDMLIVYDFEGGATDTPSIQLSRWVTSGSCQVGSHTPPCWGLQATLSPTQAEAKVNTGGAVSDTISPSSPASVSLGTNEFGEASIDLTAAGVIPINTCAPFGKVFAVSRTSGESSTAQMKDLVGPANFTISNCGTVTIIKRTSPRGLDQAFDFTSNLSGTCTTDTTPAAFQLNDKDGSDSANNTETCLNVPSGSYSVTEGANPANFGFVDVVCQSSGTGTSTSVLDKTASITLASDGVVTCVYTNQQLLGAIKITKTRKHAADGPGDHPHAGVSFTVGGVTKQTDANGVACFDGLTFGSYTVHETVPAGYVVDANDKSVTVDNQASCSGSPYVGETVSFHNTPLTNITVSVNSQVDGGTASTIDCDGVTGSTGANGDGSLTRNDLPPGTYTCTIVVDP